MRGENRCYVCFKKHERAYKLAYPMDFPNRFKFCCLCRDYAYDVGRSGLENTIKWIKSRNFLANSKRFGVYGELKN